MRVGLLAAVGSLLLAGCAGAGSDAPDLGPAPAYTATTLDGAAFDLQDPTGRAVLINLWATWCKSCLFEMPRLQQVSEAYGGQGLQVVGISMDSASDEQVMRDYIAQRGYTYTFAHDPEGADFIPAFYTSGSRGTPPETFLINGDGRIIAKWIGEFDPTSDESTRLIRAALA